MTKHRKLLLLAVLLLCRSFAFSAAERDARSLSSLQSLIAHAAALAEFRAGMPCPANCLRNASPETKLPEVPQSLLTVLPGLKLAAPILIGEPAGDSLRGNPDIPSAAPSTLGQIFGAQDGNARNGDKDGRIGPVSPESLGRLFDNSKAPPALETPVPVDSRQARAVKLPRGARSARVDTAVTLEDIDRLVPRGDNSEGIIEGLKWAIARNGALDVVRYEDGIGGSFVAVDLGGNSLLADHMPDSVLTVYEKSLIRKILGYHRDVQMIIREHGKTPDLIVDGVITELKSILGHHPQEPIEYANQQLTEFSKRHMLGGGDLALDFYNATNSADHAVYLKLVADAIRRISEDHRKHSLAIERIWVFSKDSMSIFVHQADGAYRLTDVSKESPSSEDASPAFASESLSRVRDLVSKGLLHRAQRALSILERQSVAGLAMAEVRELLECEFLYRRILVLTQERDSSGRLNRKYNPGKASKIWKQFRRHHSGPAVRELEAKISPLLSHP